MGRRLSLRTRLVLGVTVLAAVGLLAADVATYTALRGFLMDRTDESLAELPVTEMGTAAACAHAGRPFPGAQAGDYVELRSGSGEVVCSVTVVETAAEAGTRPALPADIAGGPGVSFFTVDATGGDERYRVRASQAPRGATLVVARSRADVDATLGRLLAVMLVVTAAVLAALAALALWVVRVGLRPLSDIGSTAALIAEGDLSRRVERDEPETEVGRLGAALNTMLGQIESAFRAREASEAKLRRFVADASHELRTPLSAVRAYAELFERGAGDRPEDLARSLEGIARESERMSVLVDDLLLLARLDEGRPLDREPVALDQVVGEAVDTARTVEPDRPVTLAAEPAQVVGDRQRLRQIVDNLLVNVRAHTPPGTPVEVRVGRENGSAVVEVADHGPGIAGEDAGRVFERFYRTDGSRSRSRGGVGLGLSIVAAVAEAHGGSVSVESEPGEGATFRIALPLAHSNLSG